MTQNIKKLTGIALTLTLLLAGQNAFAGVVIVGIINYTPSTPQPIPTLSGYMLMALALLFAIVAFRVLRAHSAGKPLASLVAGGVLALTAASGDYLIQNAQAIAGPAYFVTLSNAAGGSVNLTATGEGKVTNTSGVPQRITGVTGVGVYGPGATNNAPRCLVGMELQNNGFCYVNFGIL